MVYVQEDEDGAKCDPHRVDRRARRLLQRHSSPEYSSAPFQLIYMASRESAVFSAEATLANEMIVLVPTLRIKLQAELSRFSTSLLG